jgi:hypothetical protein
MPIIKWKLVWLVCHRIQLYVGHCSLESWIGRLSYHGVITVFGTAFVELQKRKSYELGSLALSC